jgi:hypothetical protein
MASIVARWTPSCWRLLLPSADWCNDNTHHLCPGGAWFETQSGKVLFRLRSFFAFPVTAGKFRFLPDPFQFTNRPTIRRYITQIVTVVKQPTEKKTVARRLASVWLLRSVVLMVQFTSHWQVCRFASVCRSQWICALRTVRAGCQDTRIALWPSQQSGLRLGNLATADFI